MKILYGLPSEGMGHATRSKVIISHLLKKHDVQIVTSDRAFAFMQTHFPGNVHEIRGFHLAYNNGAVSKRHTFTEILKQGPSDLIDNFHKYRLIHKAFRPDLVISDFESFTFFFATFHKIPIISIDNMQVINRCDLDIEIPPSEKNNYHIAKNIIKTKVPNCNYYLITSFFKARTKKDRTSLVPPILRDEIVQAASTQKDHVLVYQTSTSQNDIVPMLRKVDHCNFHVYGFNKNETHGNVMMKPFSEKGFIDDLASAGAVVTNGGFSLISEAVYLHKPVCSVPIKKQFEQFVNAAYIEECGYGLHFSDFTSAAIESFLKHLDKFQNHLNSYHQDGNSELFARLDDVIENVTR